MHELIKGARERVGLTQAMVARALHMSISNYQRYENDALPLNTELVVKLSKILDCPTLTMVWCRKGCDIGMLYCYEILNNVDLSPMAILTKYRQEEREAHEALENMALLFLNKKGAADCSDTELRELYHWSLEMLDLEHVIETLKLRLWDFLDVAELILEHNRKCLDKHYVDTKKPDLVLAG